MKRCLAALVLIISILGLCGCTRQPSQQEGKLSVMCTLFPYYDFVRAIGGEDVEARLLVAAGRETHSFEPTPLDVVALSRSNVLIYNGGESELWVEDILSAAGENIRVKAAMMDLVDLEEEEFAEGMQSFENDGDDEEDEIEYDEHIWTSPLLAQDICRGICSALCQADPDHADGYQYRLEEYLPELEALDSAFREVANNAARHELIFGDRFPLLYFCKTYGLDYRAAFHGCASDTEPSLATLKYLIDKVDSEKIRTVYTIELSNQKIAQAIAEASGAQVRTFYSCQSISRSDFDHGETYVSLMWRNVAALKEGLDG